MFAHRLPGPAVVSLVVALAATLLVALAAAPDVARADDRQGGGVRVDQLIKTLGGTDRKAAQRAKRQLAGAGPAAIPQVRAAFEDALAAEEKTKRNAALLRSTIEVLGALRDVESRERFEELLRTHEDVLVRNAAALALGQVCSLDSLATLAHVATRDASEFVRLRAVQSLAALSNAVSVLPEGPEREAALERYVALGLPAIRAGLSDDFHGVRLQAVSALGKLRDRESAPKIAVQVLAHDEDKRVRETAAKALGAIGEASAVPYLVDAAVGDANKDVRIAAGVALGSLADPRGLPAMLKMASDADRDIRIVGVHGLGNLSGDQAVKALIVALDDADKSIRKTACDSLRRLTGEMPGIGEPDDWKKWSQSR